MELTVTATVWIDIDGLVDAAQQQKLENEELDDLINDYVACLDDCDYYLIGKEEEKQIKTELEKRLKNLKK